MNRRLLEPRDLVDRALYATLAALGPNTTILCWSVPELRAHAPAMAVWSLIAIFYTIEGALQAYRSLREEPK